MVGPLFTFYAALSFSDLQKSQRVLCEYGNSSERLLKVANIFSVIDAPNATTYRNLESFKLYSHFTKEHPESFLAMEGSPVSFYIRNVEWEDEEIRALAKTLNFYMHYFDRETPLIDIHEDTVKDSEPTKFVRLPAGSFPSIVRGTRLNSYLSSLWQNSLSRGALLRYIYSYQILEYCSSYYLKEKTLQEIRLLLGAPDVLSNIDTASRKIIDIVNKDTISEVDKLNSLIETFVSHHNYGEK